MSAVGPRFDVIIDTWCVNMDLAPYMECLNSVVLSRDYILLVFCHNTDSWFRCDRPRRMALMMELDNTEGCRFITNDNEDWCTLIVNFSEVNEVMEKLKHERNNNVYRSSGNEKMFSLWSFLQKNKQWEYVARRGGTKECVHDTIGF